MPDTLIQSDVIKDNQTKSTRGGKRPGAGRKKQATNEAIADALTLTNSAAKAAALVHVSRSTINDVICSKDWPQYREKSAGKWAVITNSVLDHAQARLSTLDPQTLTPSQLQSLITSAAIGEDKIARLTNADGGGDRNSPAFHLTQTSQSIHLHAGASQADLANLAKSVSVLLKSGLSKTLPVVEIQANDDDKPTTV